MTRENDPSLDFTLPDDIYDLLDLALIPEVELNRAHRNTQKYSVAGHPDLFVRIQREHLYDPDDIQGTLDYAMAGARRLRAFEVDVLPAHAFEYDNAACIVTKRVTGVPLLKALAARPNVALLARVDRVWAGLARSAIAGRESGEPAPDDVYAPEQYMLGTIVNDPTPRVWLTDLPEGASSYHEADVYAETLVSIAGGIVSIERITARQMRLARAALQGAIGNVDAGSSARSRILAQVAARVVETGRIIGFTEDNRFHELGLDNNW